MTRKLSVGFSILLFVTLSHAQNTGGVFPPMVNEEHKLFQYRGVVNPDNSAGETGFAQRFHYEESLDGDRMWRIVGQTRKTSHSDFDFDFVQAELFWEFSEDNPNYRTGIRFDARLRDGVRPNQIGINWTNQFYFNNGWQARALFLASTHIGDHGAGGLNLQTRWSLSKSLGSSRTLGIEMFNDFGNSNNIGSLEEQKHTLGPIYSSSLTSNWSIFSGILFGASEAAPDTEFRLWLTHPM
ncbi:MAG: hypothetical protein P8J68_08525 [Arenicellaceae bacterium]|nr:hypothetical protein [Arenicellaceae bacterium]